MFNDLDPLLNSPVRLAVMSILLTVKHAHFNDLLKETQTTQGNLSHQLKKLHEAGYVQIEKTFKNNYPLTIISISPTGKKAFEVYVENIKKYLHLNENNT
ncbi:winged helix-turn-helix domain-containing protein [Aquirufa ecclesiirivi]|uniref:ArsR family transcriptional regulator n=1 Tax=Aquirufa ecclesiirivi TaxID=2715124 RepID=A0ABT4JFW9_9BACT|nr:transcriptional regulator [Aquirufa ecclesiirivi]MCZ2474446.1 ArsR family transcriptional regulator [Aquirufa ecclesiirivi]MDF0694554.1 transcriptional regulator [Aquirufa ecclesiirivi]